MSSGTPAQADAQTLQLDSPATSGYKVKDAPSADRDQVPSSNASTIAPSQGTASSSEWSLGEEQPKAKKIAWDELKYGQRLRAARRHAHCADDIQVLDTFLGLCEIKDIDSNTVKLLFRTLRLLHCCSYSAVDIASILAHASAYFIDVYAVCGGFMDTSEIGHVLVTVIFLAHSYIQDETCPLNVWHQHLFSKYCPLKKLSEAVMRVMAILKYILRLDAETLSVRYETLCKVMRVPPVDQVC